LLPPPPLLPLSLRFLTSQVGITSTTQCASTWSSETGSPPPPSSFFLLFPPPPPSTSFSLLPPSPSYLPPRRA
jgi:hypothetical protein